MKKNELLNLLGDLLIEDFEKEMEAKGKKLINKEINRLQLMNCYAKKLNKFDSLPLFCKVSYAEGSVEK